MTTSGRMANVTPHPRKLDFEYKTAATNAKGHDGINVRRRLVLDFKVPWRERFRMLS